ncbi:MAG: hypothetical protein DRP13_01060 [Candidatus Aenigmatarchaeota archaeon]|nr:MAG: hypothetical protein DRP13_01060 [Candidatus Aenigmarchaeota archaeon]
MKKELMKILACPKCKSNLKVDNISEKNGEIKTGTLKCVKCNSYYPIKNYIPRFVKRDEYVSSFSYEWWRHKKTQFDSYTGTKETEETFKEKTGFDLNKLKGSLVLDAGCGTGRFMEIVLNHRAKVVGVDLSFSVDVAQKNVGLNKNANIVQADIFNLPFKECVFDYIFSIGVLHHTPDTKKAFFSLIPFLKNGGEIAIWVYSNEGLYMKIFNKSSDFWRFFTTRISQEKLYKFCKVYANLVYPLKKIRGLRAILQILLPPTSYHPNKIWRILDTFDWLSPKYQWKHSYKEVYSWFDEAGLKDIKILSFPVALKGKKT